MPANAVSMVKNATCLNAIKNAVGLTWPAPGQKKPNLKMLGFSQFCPLALLLLLARFGAIPLLFSCQYCAASDARFWIVAFAKFRALAFIRAIPTLPACELLPTDRAWIAVTY